VAFGNVTDPCRQADGETNMIKLGVTFHGFFVDMPKNEHSLLWKPQISYEEFLQLTEWSQEQTAYDLLASGLCHPSYVLHRICLQAAPWLSGEAMRGMEMEG
jgi:hypothetical protein